MGEDPSSGTMRKDDLQGGTFRLAIESHDVPACAVRSIPKWVPIEGRANDQSCVTRDCEIESSVKNSPYLTFCGKNPAVRRKQSRTCVRYFARLTGIDIFRRQDEVSITSTSHVC